MKIVSSIIGITFLTMWLLGGITVHAAEQVINTTGMYIASASESLNDAKRHALEDAMRQATEKAGVLVHSYSKTHNMVLTDDEVITVATKIVKVTKKRYEVNLLSDSEIKVTAYIETIINTNSINDDIIALKEENKKLRDEKDIITKKQNVLEKLNDLSQNIREKYKGKFDMKDYLKTRIKLYPDSHYSLALENFYIDMKKGEYESAKIDISITSSHYKQQKNIDKESRYYYIDDNICDFQLKRIEVYLATNEYFLAMNECLYFGEALEKNNYYNKIDKVTYQKFYNYATLLKDYIDIYNPKAWEGLARLRGSIRLG